MARLLALCSLPRSNPGDRLQYKRVNGPYTRYMLAGGGNKLPYGTLPQCVKGVYSFFWRAASRIARISSSVASGTSDRSSIRSETSATR